MNSATQSGLGELEQTIDEIGGEYPGLERRYFATVIDFFAIIGVIIAAIELAELFGIADDSGKKWAILLPIIFYEAVLTSTAATVGQCLFRFRVRKFDPLDPTASLRKINIFQAYARLITKYILGTISMLTMPMDPQRRAMHDKTVNSVVVSTKQLKALTSRADS